MKVSVTNCARCGEYHKNLEFTEFRRPIVDDTGLTWTHWASCPTNGDPIIMRFKPTKEQE